MLDTTPRWMAFYTKPRAEKRVNTELQKKGFEAYLPLQRSLHKWHDRKKWVEVPLFNSYVFVKIPKTQLYEVLSDPGIVKVIKFGGEIAEVSETEIESIRRLLASEKELFVENISQMKKGAKVRLIGGGHFEGLEGELVSDCKNGNFAVRIVCVSSVIVLQMDRELMQVID